MLLSALLGESPPALPARRLVRIASLFGINENRARVALSRMAARGEVAIDDAGDYALAGRLLERARRLTVARTATTARFDGTWHLVVVTSTGDDATTRRERRKMCRDARLGELRDGTWTRPANLAVDLPTDAAQTLVRFRATPDADPRSLAASVFDLAGWARRARLLCRTLEHAGSSRRGSLAAGFELNAEVLRHLQRDPLMPDELLDDDWPGERLRARFATFDADYRARLADAHRTLASSR